MGTIKSKTNINIVKVCTELSTMIDKTPTSELRNLLCDCYIVIQDLSLKVNLKD